MTTHRPILFLSHNSAAQADPGISGFGFGVALNFEGEAAPEWVELTPPGPTLRGHDGRVWRLDDPQKLVAAFRTRGLSRPFDINHSTFIRAPKGEDAPAVGWIEELAVRENRVVGRVAWNAEGARAIREREYRYVSPSFHFDKAGNVVEIVGAGLVNTPNFSLPALNSESQGMKDLLTKLGLAETATENDAIAALDRLMTAQNAQRPDPALFVPRADYELALNRASQAERKIADDAGARLKAAAVAAVEQAILDRKIAPTSRDYHLANCAEQAGFDRFAAMVKELPALLPDVDVSRDAARTGVALNAEQRDVAVAMGLDEKAFAAFIASQK